MAFAGPPPPGRDAYHDERLYWQRNPPQRPPNSLTVREAARALGILEASVRAGIRTGTYVPMKHSFGNRIFFNHKYIADIALARDFKRIQRGR